MNAKGAVGISAVFYQLLTNREERGVPQMAAGVWTSPADRVWDWRKAEKVHCDVSCLKNCCAETPEKLQCREEESPGVGRFLKKTY